MRLLRVEFEKMVYVPGHGDTQKVSSDMVALNYDEKTDMVQIGVDGDEVPRSQVRQWKRDRTRTPPQIKAQCPECPREFDDNRALGAHRHKAHGVNGTTRQR